MIEAAVGIASTDTIVAHAQAYPRTYGRPHAGVLRGRWKINVIFRNGLDWILSASGFLSSSTFSTIRQQRHGVFVRAPVCPASAAYQFENSSVIFLATL
ncbi:MAG: hypothetical protein CMM07_05885 [Rhodopirellula sp.]|nr:hypothetical protein [Rhodopirellula sp.]